MPHDNYQGMRWYKCDLQMQTPADAQHWRGEQIDNDLEKVAEDYARACYEEGLDVIGITEHNFIKSKEFIPALRNALDKLEKEYERHIILFPGFEFTANVGKGVHVLCLFEPNRDLEEIDDILTQCGVNKPRLLDNNKLRTSPLSLQDIIDVVQKPNNAWQGIVIVPHIRNKKHSLFSNSTISEWLQQKEFVNPDLLVAEVPMPVSQMHENWQKLFKAGDDCHPEWRRERPIATIMSSDNKMLNEKDEYDHPVSNSIGYRYTWIKMSEPSIESLRQAFLDHESRIILPDDVVTDVPPAEREKYARIKSVSISNAEFLQDQTVFFSPNLNCIIGGRGTGKSTILESIRIALNKTDDIKSDEKTKEKTDRIQRLLNQRSDTEIRVCWQNWNGIEDEIVYTADAKGDGKREVDGREMADLDSFLQNIPVQIFSQQQLNSITDKEDNMLLFLLNDFIRDDIQQLRQKATEIQNDIRTLFTVKRQFEQIEADIRRLNQEISELERQIEKLNELLADFKRYQRLKAADDYMKGIIQKIADDNENLLTISDAAENLATTHKSPQAQESQWPEGKWFDDKDTQFIEEMRLLREKISVAVRHYRNTVNGLYFEDEKWPEIRSLIDNAEAEFIKACEEKGVAPEDIKHIQELNEQLRKKRIEREEKIAARDKLRREIDQIPGLFTELHENWRSEYEQRQNIAEDIIEKLAGNIQIEIQYATKQKDFLEKWNDIAATFDKRYRMGRYWSDIGEAVHEAFCKISQETSEFEIPSPWQLVESCLSGEIDLPEEISRRLNRIEVELAELRDLLRGELRDKWEAAQITRVADTVDLILYRTKGGAEAGRISDGSLSDGQRNTAALFMILARGNTPLIFDQPEDELDSKFIFQDLVPMLRTMKTERQIILVTHNANLPVNADAELVYALETRNGSGYLKAQGGLDRTGVTKAVLDIMEGSEAAFKRRREKYNF